MPRRKMTEAEIITSFWRRVDKGEYCWNWTGKISEKGYGVIYTHYRENIKAHIFSYELAYGHIQGNKNCVCHTCDNFLCVRPDHLFLGTNLDNSTDMVVKNRSAYGERHSQAILTDNQVDEIRMLFKTGWTQSKLVGEYGSTSATISRIVNYKTRNRLPKLPIPKLVNPTDAEKLDWINKNRKFLRSLLQYYGTEYRRKQDPDYWTKKLALRLDNHDWIVVSDVRTPDEMDVIRKAGGEIWFVERPGVGSVGIKNHYTEVALEGSSFDRTILNDGSIDELKHRVEWLFKDMCSCRS